MVEFFSVLKADKTDEFFSSLELFIGHIHDSVVSMEKTLEHYCNDDIDAVKELSEKVLRSEKKADVIRRHMEQMLYKGVLVPFGREDKYNLLEALDDVADRAEIVVRIARIERPKVPDTIKDGLKDMASLVVKTSKNLKKSVLSLDKNLDKSIQEATSVELDRERVRNEEFKLLEALFSDKKNTKLQLMLIKELISLLGRVADRAEEAADRVTTLAVKYQN
ncbi:TPA: DUF47 family protein [archaeon]|nr:DUF47 family protein [Candidatus Undinarchaeales archaeon SRR5007147.bin71]